MTYQPDPQRKTDGEQESITTDDRTQQLLRLLIIEVRVANLYLELMSDEKFTEDDLEERE